MDKRLEWTLNQRKYVDGKKAHTQERSSTSSANSKMPVSFGEITLQTYNVVYKEMGR